MANLSRLTGTPWHVEKYAREDGDGRRHRSRCLYYEKEGAYCRMEVGRCKGAAHCAFYKEKDVLKTSEVLSAETDKGEEIKQPFTGIRSIALSDIKTEKGFKQPDPQKLEAVIKYYRENGRLDKPVVVSCKGDHYVLEDKYLRYYAAGQLGLESISAVMKSEISDREGRLLYPIGSRVVHGTCGIGVVRSVKDGKITVAFEQAGEKKFDIKMCQERGLLNNL